jgi:hypothetical protein
MNVVSDVCWVLYSAGGIVTGGAPGGVQGCRGRPGSRARSQASLEAVEAYLLRRARPCALAADPLSQTRQWQSGREQRM